MRIFKEQRVEFSIKAGTPEKLRSGCIAVGVIDARKLTPAAAALDKAAKGYLTEILRRGDLDAKAGATLALHNVPGTACERVLLVSLGKEAELSDKDFRGAIGATAKALADHAALLTKLDERTRAPSVPPTINVHQAPITVHTPAVSVANHLPNQEPPVVDVKVEAVMPESPSPEVHAHFEATLPEVKAPDVRVDVTNNVPPAEVNVHLPARRIESDVKRDRDGNLVHVTQIETDLIADGASKSRRALQ